MSMMRIRKRCHIIPNISLLCPFLTFLFSTRSEFFSVSSLTSFGQKFRLKHKIRPLFFKLPPQMTPGYTFFVSLYKKNPGLSANLSFSVFFLQCSHSTHPPTFPSYSVYVISARNMFQSNAWLIFFFGLYKLAN